MKVRLLNLKKTATLLLLLITSVNLSQAQTKTWGDYTLYSIKSSTKAYLLNLDGTIYHTWTFGSTKTTGYSSYLLPGGVILRAVARSGNSFSGGPICGEVQKVAWDNTVIWDYVYSTTEYCSHHDICPMPNGNVLLIAYEAKTSAQVSSAGCSQSIVMWPDKIVEIQPVGTSGGIVVWEWHAWDHLSQNLYSAKSNYVSSIVEHPELLNINYQTQKDWMHMNGLDYNEQLDQITFSAHYMNEVYVIDHSTTTAEAASHSGGNSGKGGDLLYRWGNPVAYSASGSADFNVVHDAHWVPQDCPRANYLVGFNNKGGTGGKTCVDVFNPPYNGYNYSSTPNTAYAPSTYNWRHTYSGSPTSDEGNSQQLPNGNTLVNISFSGYMYEIDSNQNVVWSKTVSGTNTSAFRYSKCYVDGPPVVTASASPAQICAGTSSQLTAKLTSGNATSYNWTSVPAGFTSSTQNPTVNPSETTIYTVTASDGVCTGTASVVVTVNSPITVTATATPSSVCPGQSSQLTAQVNTTGSCTYSWTSIPAGFTSSLQNPTVNPSETTTYNVTATEGGVCSTTHSITITVANSFIVTAAATPSSICQGQSSQLTAQVNTTGSFIYSWTSIPAGFTSTLQNPTVNPSETTAYSVTATVGSCTAVNSVNATVNPLPVKPSLYLSGDTIYSSSSTGNQWYFNTDLISGANSYFYELQQDGNYQVQVTDANGCTSLISDAYTLTTTSIDEPDNNITIYPNPNNGIIHIKGIPAGWNDYKISVYDFNGRRIKYQELSEIVDLTSFANGMVCIVISSQSIPVISRKISIQK